MKQSFILFILIVSGYTTLFSQNALVETDIQPTDSILIQPDSVVHVPYFTLQDSIFNSKIEKPKTPDIYTMPYSLMGNYPNYKGLARNMGIYFGASVAAVGILWMLPESFTNWDKEQMRKDGIFSKWSENVKAGPVIDKDDFMLNYVWHPYFGAVYYTSARSQGFNALYSFGFSAFMSTCFWEYGVEAFAEKPSLQDLIITPVGGALVGEVFYLAKRSIVRNDYRLLNSRFLGHTATFLMDPMSEVVDLCTGNFKKRKNLMVSSYPSLNTSGGLSYNIALKLSF